jgi:hypothetical protein
VPRWLGMATCQSQGLQDLRHPRFSTVWRALNTIEPWLDASFPIATTLICINQRLAAYCILTISLALRLVNHADQSPWRWILISLLIVNGGLIIQDLDTKPNGPSDYLIIALSFAAGLNKSNLQWKRSLTWMASCIIPLLLLSLRAGDKLIVASNSFTGFNINKIGFLAGLLIILSYGLLRQAETPRGRLWGAILLSASATEALISQSRSAIAVPIVAITIDQLSYTNWTLRRSLLAACACLMISAIAVYGWYGSFALKGNTLSDLNRLETIRCWLTSTGTSKQGLFLGLGYNKTAQDFCGSDRIPSLKTMGKTKGLHHAHNFYAQIFAETGITGLIMAVAFTVLAFKRAWEWKTHGLRPTGFPLMIYLFLMALGITYWQVLMLNQVLVGYSLAFFSAAAPHPAVADASTPSEPTDAVSPPV